MRGRWGGSGKRGEGKGGGKRGEVTIDRIRGLEAPSVF